MTRKEWKIFSYSNIHTHLPEENSVMSIEFDSDVTPIAGIPFTLGVHPWRADKDIDWEKFERQLQNNDIVGIGETGLDSLRGPELDLQQEVFAKQLQLAEKYQLPVVIHSVRNNHRILALKKKLRPTVPWIIHGFRGNLTEARQLTDAGIHLSLGKHYNQEVAENIPQEFLHRETDAIK